MSEAVVTALIAGVCVGIPSVIASVLTNNKHNAIIMYRIEELEKKQDKHNGAVERIYKLENDMKTVFIKYDGLKERLDRKEN